ncbi:MAG: ATP phosphoribosyltransferase regulatory subunit [Butyrivibrio sp.]|nr:ATP phosphoribosyltransferase regulatory subunit [Butyrivibrio sp.]
MNKVLLHTPEGVRDIYGSECSDRRIVIGRIIDIIKSYGYMDIDTPTFEYFDVFEDEINAGESKELYKFFDKEGNTLVLRPDFTPSVARCASKVMLENNEAVRVVYQGKTFLNTSSLQGKLKENYDIGVELMNDNSVYADAEMIALLIESLKNSGLNDFQVSIGDADYYKGICEEAGIDDDTEMAVREQILQKNYFAAESIMTERGVEDRYKDMIIKVSDFIGSDNALSDALLHVKNERSVNAIGRLKELYQVLCRYGVEKYVSFDLSMLSKFNYYTGVIFSAYTYGVGEPIAKGGRYDNLLGKFGKDAPSIGFAITLDLVMSALFRQGIELEHDKEALEITFTDETFTECLNKAQKLRKDGKNVVLKRA